VNDDELTFNTQSGSQIDGFRHYGHYKTRQFWNGQSQEDIIGVNAATADITFNSIHHWAEKGIVGRGVLLDYKAWAQAHNMDYSAITQHHITAQQLDQVVKYQGTELRQGDLLFIRTGFIDWHNHAPEEEKIKVLSQVPPSIVGLEQNEASLRWLYDHHFSFVAADNPSFELRPTIQEWNLHDYLLPQWGTPIGELFDFEKLGQTCKELKRWSFLVTSAPLNVMGGIASPPNALALF